MVDINWDEAPEGTTHVVIPGITRHPWRKVDVANDKVYVWMTKAQDGHEGEWCDRRVESVEAYLGVNNNLLVERPVVEAELPDGLVWPRGYTHWNRDHGGFFFKEEGYLIYGKENDFMAGAFNYWIGHEKTIERFPGAKPKAPVEQPVKKKPVGWWN